MTPKIAAFTDKYNDPVVIRVIGGHIHLRVYEGSRSAAANIPPQTARDIAAALIAFADDIEPPAAPLPLASD